MFRGSLPGIVGEPEQNRMWRQMPEEEEDNECQAAKQHSQWSIHSGSQKSAVVSISSVSVCVEWPACLVHI